MDYSKTLLKIRAKLNLSQQELADILKVSFTTLNRWENNKTVPSKKHLALIESICLENNIVYMETNK